MRNLMIALAGLLTWTAGARASDLRYFDDAPLRAVQFLDGKEGWAVGDDGVIWHSIDGGANWERQPSGTRASLRGVHFLTPYLGWAVGREELSAGRSAGVLLFTRDGGLKWERLLPNTLPGLHQVRFVDARTGFLLGDAADIYPTGLFKTVDGGKSWEPVQGPRGTAWLAGDFQKRTYKKTEDGKLWQVLPGAEAGDEDTLQHLVSGVLVGAWSRLGTLKGEQMQSAADLELLAGRHVHGVQMLADRALAVAQGGALLSSTSGGARWGIVDTKLPDDVRGAVDFQGLHAVGNRVWVVGRPGSMVLHSPDGGATWRTQHTGQALPLHGVFFFDDQRGWAVGDGGTILATSDGGASWKAQRQGARRVALLAVQARAEAFAADAFARFGAADGACVAGLRAVAPEPLALPSGQASEHARYDAAVRAAGGMAADHLWQFPVPTYLSPTNKQAVLAHWNHLHGQQAERALVRQLVLALRMWRPSVVVGDHPDSPVAANALVAEALQEAVRLAADPQAFPEQLSVLGLTAWQVERTFGACDPSDATCVLDNHEARLALDGTVRELGQRALRLLAEAAEVPGQRGYRLLQCKVPLTGNLAHPLQGLALDRGDAAREVDEPAADPRRLAAIRERRHLLALSTAPDTVGKSMSSLMQKLEQLPDDQAMPLGFELASRQAQQGHWLHAGELHAYLVKKYPAHPLAADSYRWLLRQHTSGEVRRRYELKHFDASAEVTPVRHVLALPPGASVSPASERRDWLLRGVDEAKAIGAFGPLAAADSAVQFKLNAARRQLGETQAALEGYRRFAQFGSGPLQEAARAELWLADRSQPAPKRVGHCRLTEVRPHLDGDFDDACWKDLPPLVLAHAAGQTADYRTEARFAYDQEFLYVALRCQHPKGQQVPPVKLRTTDADLEPFDRVSLLLDVDRDYSSAYQLQVDQRGCVRDDCCGDLRWNPRWFVACKSGGEAWQIEAAIPLAELQGGTPALGSAWAFNLTRVLPDRGVQSFALPADMAPLLFQRDAHTQPMQPAP